MSEISGILKNGIDRGWQLEEIKKSLMNAGYSLKDIEAEILSFQAKPIATQEIASEQKYNSQSLSNYQTTQLPQKKSTNIILYSLGALIGIIIISTVFFLVKS